jgi:dihydrofolate reductase
MKIIAIAAVAKNGVIGKGSELPWSIPEDMKFFRDSTRDQIVVMGRKTFDSLGKALPKRENAVITRDASWKRDGVKVFSSLGDAISYYKKNENLFPDKTIFVIGGAEIYKLSLPLLDEVWLTEIDSAADGDIFFPDFKDGKFQRPEFERVEKRAQNDRESSSHLYAFVRYARRG